MAVARYLVGAAVGSRALPIVRDSLAIKYVGQVRSVGIISSSSALSFTIGEFSLPLPRQYLRLMDSSNFDPVTGQRLDVPFDVSSGKPLFLKGSTRCRYEIDRCFIQKQNSDQSAEKITELTKNSCNKSLFGETSQYADSSLIIKWKDGHTSQFKLDWLAKQVKLWQKHQTSVAASSDYFAPKALDSDTVIGPRKWILDSGGRVFWRNVTESDIRSFNSSIIFREHKHEKDVILPPMTLPFYDIVRSDPNPLALEALYRYGFLLVTDTPLHNQAQAVAAFASAVSGGANKSCSRTSLVSHYLETEKPATILADGTDGPLRTMYGNVWTTNSDDMADGQSIADSAYGRGALPLHTDMGYIRDPPGLQVFSMSTTAAEGGESVFADGFSVAETLRVSCPDAFRILSETNRRFRSIDTINGWHLEASGPVIETWGDGSLRAIRYNELDRLPDFPSLSPSMCGQIENQITDFYELIEYSHNKWNELIAMDEFTLVIRLKPGDMVAIANQRCLHGRYSFRNKDGAGRSIVGCYVSQDELMSRFRNAGLLPEH